MKVLYADPASFNGHLSFNKSNIRVLQNVCELSTYFRKGYMDYSGYKIAHIYESELNCFPINIPYKGRVRHYLSTKIGQSKIVREILKIAVEGGFDLVIFSWVDIAVFSSLTKWSKMNIAFYEHGLYITTKKNWKWLYFFWKNMNKNIKVIILEKYFSSYIKHDLHCNNRQFLIRFPIEEFDVTSDNKEKEMKHIIFAPSQSNDPGFIQMLKQRADDIPEEYHIIVRGRENYKTGRLCIYKDSLLRSEYDYYSINCSAILIPYPSDFNYRTSGVLFDGIACGKMIILQTGNTLEYYANTYPALFGKFSSIDDFFMLLKDGFTNYVGDRTADEIRFKDDYSDKSLVESFNHLLSNQEYTDEQ